jgi:hypothetical protein
MKDAARVTGDVSTFKSSNGYYVVYFGTRDSNHYATVNMRQILVKPETIDKSLYSDDPNDDEYNVRRRESQSDGEGYGPEDLRRVDGAGRRRG